MDKDNYCLINGKSYNFSEIINILPSVGDKDTDTHPFYLVGLICDKTSLDWNSSKDLVDIILETKRVPIEFNGTVEIKTNESNTPHCPICNSTNLTKITATKKAIKIAAFGIFGMGDNGKTWKCNDCGSKF